MKKIYELKPTYLEVGEYAGEPVTSPAQIIDYLAGAFDEYRDQEQFWVICLDGANQPICRRMVTLGLVNQTQVHPREAFRYAVAASAVSVIFAHNHPSGTLKPSPEDLRITSVLVEAGRILCIPVLDHLIICPGTGWSSIKAINPSLF